MTTRRIPPQFDESEAKALATLATSHRKPHDLAVATYRYLGAVADRVLAPRRQDPAARVVLCLIHRASNDLRCLTNLAMRGYPAQAGTLGASAVEAVLTAAFVGRDKERAQKWIDHESRWESFMKPTQLIARVLTGSGNGSDFRYVKHAYRELCVAKHANPVYQPLINAELKGSKRVHFFNGPDTGEVARQSGFFAMHVTSVCLMIGLEFVREAYLTKAQIRKAAAMWSQCVELARECTSIAQAEKWGSEYA